MVQLARDAASDPWFDAELRRLVVGSSIDSLDLFLRANYRYRDEREEIIRTPQFMLNDLAELGYLEGDCDDISTLAAAALLVLGSPRVLFRAISYTPGAVNFEHVFVNSWNGQGWFTIDPTVPLGTVHEELQVMIQEV